MNWKNASQDDLRRLEAIQILLADHKKLLPFLFDESRARLNDNEASLKKRAGVFSKGEQILVRVAIDIWKRRRWDSFQHAV